MNYYSLIRRYGVGLPQAVAIRTHIDEQATLDWSHATWSEVDLVVLDAVKALNITPTPTILNIELSK